MSKAEHLSETQHLDVSMFTKAADEKNKGKTEINPDCARKCIVDKTFDWPISTSGHTAILFFV